VSLVNVAQRDQREHQQHPGVSVPGAPKILAQFVVHVVGIVDQQSQNTDASKNDGWKQDQQDACCAARSGTYHCSYLL
jgi:hypothetical protein